MHPDPAPYVLEQQARAMLAHWPEADRHSGLEPLIGGGFSGSALWRTSIADRELLLRRWPGLGPSDTQIRWIHQVLETVWTQGFRQIAVPLQIIPSVTVCKGFGYRWDLSPWLPGKAAKPESATTLQIRAALVALARFHQAALADTKNVEHGVPQGIVDRRQKIRRWRERRLERMPRIVRRNVWPAGFDVAQRFLELSPQAIGPIDAELSRVANLQVPLQPCLRDVWSEHLLFTHDEVTGIIDYGAMRIDHVACDIARLLGSYASDDSQIWQQGLEAYQTVCALSDDELQLVRTFDRSTVLLAGLNWIEWIYRERRQFNDLASVLARLEHFLTRIEHLLISP